ncbi:MarR family winged helix-turn-helix transcriptional regulator [Solibaculum mannosilyticum]|uniref:MarR family winged helix-turn-helix transcriptional regulator n=1 Tax=Solibaculum mannosilyticum TaxID=2780922 RepID=UPI0034AD386B
MLEETQAKKLMESMRRLKKVAGKIHLNGDVPQGEFFMLHTIRSEMRKQCENGAVPVEGITISQLSRQLHIAMPTVSQTISILEEKGLVQRLTYRHDRRKVYVALTEYGRMMLERMAQQMSGMMDEVMDRLGEENVEQLIGLIDKLYDILDDIQKQTTKTENH